MSRVTRNHPRGLEMKSEAIAAGAQVKQARSDYFPSAGATAGYSAMGTGLPAANNFNAGIVVTWPIFNGFATYPWPSEVSAREARMVSLRRPPTGLVRAVELAEFPQCLPCPLAEHIAALEKSMCGPMLRRKDPDNGSNQTTIAATTQRTVQIVYASSKNLTLACLEVGRRISTNIFAHSESEAS
jgi:hypothetical protein